MKQALHFVVLLAVWLTLAGCAQRNEPPTARISEPPNGARFNELTVTFKAQVEDPEDGLASTIWYFGDGVQEAGGSEISHTYQQGGNYTVRVTATDDAEQSATASVGISINQRPSAAARAQVEVDGQVLPFVKAIQGKAPLEVRFEGGASRDADGSIVGYHWVFGDGATSDEADPTHTYTSAGRFEATLTVTDNEGLAAVDRVTLSLQMRDFVLSDLIDVGEGVPETALVRGFILAGQDTNQTVLYHYRALAAGPFSREQIRLMLLDNVLGLAQRPEISQVTVYLFGEPKPGFMEPGDYDHYLGMAVWERPESGADLGRHVVDNTALTVNEGYLDGTASTVAGYELNVAELEADDPRCTICPERRVFYVNLVLNPPPTLLDVPAPAPLCRQQAEATIQAVLQRGLQTPGAYALNIYEGSATSDGGVAVGLWGAQTDLDGLQTAGLLFVAPEAWTLDGDAFKLQFVAELPDCGSP